MIRLRFGLGALRSAPGLVVGLVLFSLIAPFLLLSLSLSLTAYREATTASAQAHFGRYSLQATAAFPETERYLRDWVARGEAVGIATTQAVVRDEQDHGAAAQARLSSGPADLGVLAAGSYPQKPGEATISIALAEALGVSPSGTVTLTPESAQFDPLSLRVTGLSTNPADTSELLIDAIAPRTVAAVHEEAEAWLISSEVEKDPFFEQSTSTGGIRTGTEEIASQGLLEEARAADFGRLEVLRGVLAVVVTAGIAALGLAYLHRHAAALSGYQASGGDTAAGTLWLSLPALVVSTLGALAGTASALAVFRLWPAEIGRWWNQDWVSPHPGTSLVLLALCLIGGLAAVGAVLFLRARHRGTHIHHSRPLSPPARRAWLVLGVIALCLCGFFLYMRWGLTILQGHRFALVCAALAAGAISLGVRWSRSELRYRARLPKPALTFFSTALLTGMIGQAALTSAAAGVHIHHITTAVPGAEGYLVVTHVDSNKVFMLTERFPEIMDTAVVLLDPVAPERAETYPRATHGRGAECFPQHVGEVFGGPLCDNAPLGLVALAASPRAEELINHGGEQYVTSGTSGIVFYHSATGTIQGAVPLPGITGTPLLDSELMPNIVLDANSPEVHRLGLVTSTITRILIPEFSSFSPEQQREFKAVLIGQASYGYLAQAQGPQVQALRTEQILYPLIASAIALIVLTALLVLHRQQQRPLRRVLADSHAGRAAMLRLLLPVLGPWALALVLGSVVGLLSTQDISFLDNPGRIFAQGLWWAAPVVVAALGCAAASTGALLSKND
ncbi:MULTISPECIES: hypothetical protein [unclassified Corynebacterium]|uniref:hypothetical protein n=1 Tax=unclassified Corynebacterium TaxID=2624378 RepID=UPI0029C9E63D|nr:MULTISPECIES: hypothetical protein [unclassified Corynebacterium]WPF65960.1 hypothetical protein OLX12_10460 [Corynebacterium sp. 22KM0430]WPF68453.1 hypothetical protein OLW90_10455 [Corynebacterium sp. 21KM1197]